MGQFGFLMHELELILVYLRLFLIFSADLSAFTNKVCGSNFSLVNSNETRVMQLSKSRHEGKEGGAVCQEGWITLCGLIA